jgi:hypothetical protein
MQHVAVVALQATQAGRAMPMPMDETMQMTLKHMWITGDAGSHERMRLGECQEALMLAWQGQSAHQVLRGHHGTLERVAHPVAAIPQRT